MREDIFSFIAVLLHLFEVLKMLKIGVRWWECYYYVLLLSFILKPGKVSTSGTSWVNYILSSMLAILGDNLHKTPKQKQNTFRRNGSSHWILFFFFEAWTLLDCLSGVSWQSTAIYNVSMQLICVTRWQIWGHLFICNRRLHTKWGPVRFCLRPTFKCLQ